MRPLPRPRVLVCDDEETVRLVCEQALERSGYVVHAAATGIAAIEAAASETFDAFVLDVRMPDLDGPRVLARLRALDPDVPCLVISGYADFEAAIQLLRHGASDFLKKPFDVPALVEAVDRVRASTRLSIDSSVLATTQTIFSSLDEVDTLRAVLGVARALLAADPTVILGSRAHRLDELAGVTVTAAEGGLGLLESDRPVVLDATTDAELVATLAPGARGVIAQPLVAHGRNVGWLLAARGPDERSFGERDVRRAELLAVQVALALENGRLHAETRAQARELERALDRLIVAERIATVARLASGLGHEIANPASAIQAHLEIAADRAAAGKHEAVADSIRRAQAGARSILDICQALRPLGTSGQRVLPVDLRQVIDGALLLVSYELRGRARVVVEPPATEPLLSADVSRLGQVFLNLLLNAAQAIPPGKPNENEVRITFGHDGGTVIARVHDTGPGVPEELREKIFEPSITTKTTGHGMGLAICRWILEEMGGEIRCLPAARGAIFEVRLPPAPPTSP